MENFTAYYNDFMYKNIIFAQNAYINEVKDFHTLVTTNCAIAARTSFYILKDIMAEDKYYQYDSIDKNNMHNILDALTPGVVMKFEYLKTIGHTFTILNHNGCYYWFESSQEDHSLIVFVFVTELFVKIKLLSSLRGATQISIQCSEGGFDDDCMDLKCVHVNSKFNKFIADPQNKRYAEFYATITDARPQIKICRTHR